VLVKRTVALEQEPFPTLLRLSQTDEPFAFWPGDSSVLEQKVYLPKFSYTNKRSLKIVADSGAPDHFNKELFQLGKFEITFLSSELKGSWERSVYSSGEVRGVGHHLYFYKGNALNLEASDFELFPVYPCRNSSDLKLGEGPSYKPAPGKVKLLFLD